MIIGQSGHPLPIFFLDTDLPENLPEDRALTAELYGGDNRYRLCQELILGIGGLRMIHGKYGRVLGMVLAGGKGERLMPLTRYRAKPAVPFAAKYRIIDFALSNMISALLVTC